MATEKTIVDHILACAAESGPVRARAMFGEYAFYCRDRVVALICDNRLFLKPTPVSAKLLPDAELAPPYPGAKDHVVVPDEIWEDSGVFPALVAGTADHVPPPKPKRKRAAQS